MKKTTQLSNIKVRWLNTQSLILILLCMYLPFIKLNAQTYTYTGAVQTVTLPVGSYEIEMWGGNGETAASHPPGGLGGYSKGTYTVTSTTTLYIAVGGKGNLSPTTNAFAPGGWNGGGQGYASTVIGAGGGGASHIATITGTLPSLSGNQSAILMVAGGGGGSGYNGIGGHGGGLTGGNGNSGTGGTTGGTFGQGANGVSGSTVGGGGGGWFGGNLGNPGNTGGSGGGSGYIGGVTSGVTIMFGQPGFMPNPDTTGNGTVVITNMAPCTGTPTAGTATVTARACTNDPFTLSATGSTKAGSIAYQWQSSSTATGPWADITGATNSNYTITNQATTTYYRLMVTCANGGGTATTNVVSMSQAAITNLSENFDTTATGTTSTATFPSCWSYIDEITTTGYGYVVAANAQSTPNSFRLYRTMTTANAPQNLVLISPQTDNLGNGTKQLRFYARATNTNANNLQIVRSNGTTSSDTFTVIQTISVNHTGYQEYIVHLPATTDDYFGFRLAHNGTTTVDINIDDVYYEDIDTCLYPTGVTISNIAQTTADISWTASTSASVTAYEYEVRSTGAPGSGLVGLGATGITPNATTTSVNVTSLSPSVNYTVYVRSICGTSTGKWTPVPISFYTLCGVVTTNFFEGFETTATGTAANPKFPLCWTYINTTGGTSAYGDVRTAASRTGNNGYYTYRPSATNGDILLVSPETNNLGNGTKQIRFWAKKSAAAPVPNFEIYTMDGNTPTSTKTLVQAVPLTDQWQEFIVPLPVTTNDYFAFSFDRVGTAPYVYLDDIYYEDLSPCIFPMNLQVNSITETTAALSWTASAAAGVTGYEYEVRSSGAPGSGSTGLEASGSTTSPTTTANITGLIGATDYIVYVRSKCGSSSGVWTLFPVNFRTACPIYVNDFFEGFENTAIGTAANPTSPLCWTYINTTGGTAAYGYVNTTSKRSGNNGYYTYRPSATNGDILLVSPETNNLGNGTKQIRFWAKKSAAAPVPNFEIYTMNGNTATSTKTLVQAIPLTTTWEEFTVALPITTDDYFVFSFERVGTAPYVYLDDIYYEDKPAPTVAATHTDILCGGEATGTATATVTGGALPLSYSWAPSGGTAATASGLTAGTYTVTVTDALNRTATETVTIIEPDALESNIATTDIGCNGANNGSVVLAPTGGVAPYTYLWNTGATTSSITGLSGGTYTVTITDDNGCTLTETATVTEPDVLEIANSSHTDVSSYGGNDGEATVTVTGGTAPYTYSWSPSGGTNDTASGLIAGTYTVTVTDANGCTATESFTIIQPIPLMVQSTSQTNVKCNGGSNGTATIAAMGGNAPYTYLWSPSGGTNATATGLAAGTYSVLVTDSTANTITESFTITEPGAIAATVSHKGDVLCNGGNNGTATITVIGGTAPFTYTWSNGLSTTNATVSNLVAGNYTVQVTDANGCTAGTAVTVTITQPAAIVFTATNSTNISCYGLNDGTISVAASGGVAPYTYMWSNGQSGSSLNNLGQGIYVVTVTDANNCTKTQSFTITEPAFVLAPTASSQNFCVGANATLANVVINGSNIKWYSAATGGTLLPSTTALVNGTTYYASQTVGTCESTTRTAVQITVSQAPVLTTTQLNVCSNSRVQTMVVDGFNYTQLKWYSSSTSTIQLPSSTLLATGTYYVSSVVGICESARQAIQVTVAAAVPAPTASFQTVCGGSTLNDLVVAKDPSATLNWYSSMQSMIPLANTTAVSTGTYYVQQVLGNCESSRIAVQVQVINITIPTVNSITTCEGTTIAELNTNGSTNYVWYTDNSTTTPLPSSFVITSGSYYIANQNASCISARKNIAVNVSARPASPTGAATQHFDFSAKVSDLQMNEPNVKWFLSAADAEKMTNMLSANTPLTDATTYYGVIVSPNNCGSLVATAVKVTINLSNAELDLAQLKYYPNPVDTELNISYIEEIKKVEIFTITGQRVFGNDYQSNEVKVDLSKLSAGTYLVKIETAKASQFVKIVKR